MNTEHDMLDLLTEMVELHGSQRKAAAHLGISAGQLNDVLHGRFPVSDTIARKLGYERVVCFRKVEGER